MSVGVGTFRLLERGVVALERVAEALTSASVRTIIGAIEAGKHVGTSGTRWVPIAERMPATRANVWLAVAGEPGVVQGYSDGERWQTDRGTDRHGRAPWTHWMPREPDPEPPR